MSKLGKLEKDLFPWIGKIPISEIEPPELLKHIRRVVGRGALDGAHRLLYDCSKIWAHAIATGKAASNPAIQLKGILPPVKNGHYPAPTDPKDLAPMLVAMDNYQGTLVVKSALKIVPLVFLRPGELRAAEWSEFDLEAALWSIPGPRMKMENDHIIPLSHQVVSILKELQPLTGNGKYVFPSIRSADRPMSDNTLNTALRTLGFTKDQIVAHGFRATARTMLDEIHEYRVDFVEHQLAHAVKDPNGRAYNRTKYLPQRRQMMQSWADYLDGLKAGLS